MTRKTPLILFILISILILNSPVMKAQQKYDKLWKQVEVFSVKDLPQSAIKQTRLIYDTARKEKNFSQMLRASLVRMSLRGDVAPDSFRIDINEMETWLKQTANPVDAAILHALIGQSYMDRGYETDYRDKETNESYPEMALEHFRTSLKNKDALAQVTVDSYLPLIDKKKDSALFGHDLLSMLAAFVARNMESLENVPKSEVVALYSGLATYYEQRGNKDAAILERLNELQVRQEYDGMDKSLKRMSPKEYKAALLDMISRNEGSPVCADVYSRLLDADMAPKEKLEYARTAMQKYPQSGFFNRFKSVEAEVLSPQLNVRMESKILCGKLIGTTVSFKNCSSVTFIIRGRNVPAKAKVQTFELHPASDYTVCEDKLALSSLPAGNYRIIAEADGAKDSCALHLTTLKLVSMPLPDKRIRMAVVNEQTGRPIADCKIIFYESNDWRSKERYRETVRTKTDASGEVIIKALQGSYAKAVLNESDETEIQSVRESYGMPGGRNSETVIRLYTDRSIYRPGQTVHVAGLVYHREGDEVKVASEGKYTINLIDANYKTIASKDVQVNEMGSVDADFSLPSSCLNGRFQVEMNSGRVSFRVEEYKRPTYQVTFLPVKENFSIGDSVTLVGEAKAFSGAPVQTAKVRYSVRRTQGFWFRFFTHRDEDKDLSEGEIITDSEGRFSIPVFLDKEDLDLGSWFWNVNYVVSAEVTDVAGETQQAEYTLPLAKVSYRLEAEIPSQMKKDAIKDITVKAFNLKNEPVQVKGSYSIFKSRSDVKTEKPLLTGTFSSGVPFKINAFSSLPSGDYRCLFASIDEKGDTVETQKTVVLFTDAKESIDMDEEWIYLTSEDFNPKKSADLYFVPKGVADAFVFYDVFSGTRQLESKRIVTDKGLQHFHYDYKPEYKDGISIILMYVKDGVCHQFRKNIILSYPEKKLTLKWETFRDKLHPGQSEEWRLSIKDSEGKSVKSELLATLYDASLDKLYGHEWNLGLGFDRNLPYTQWNFSNSYGNASLWLNFRTPSFSWKEREFDTFKDFTGFHPHRILFESAVMGTRSLGAKNYAVQMDAAPAASMKMASVASVEESPKPATIRENFAETAFFYPHLLTDKNGIATISFTLPESLTEWKFMGLAHTQVMDYGQIEARAKASKDFMVQPNMPRFVRAGDEASISTRLMNLADKDISGIVKMELVDPETEKIIESRENKFAVAKGQTEVSTFSFTVREDYPLLICRIVADGQSFSDGEQNYLPVLSNKQWITESVPLTLRDKGNRSFDLTSLFNHDSKTATQRRLTIEFSQTPAWMLLQSLSLLSTPQDEDAASWSSAYYVNVMAGYLTEHLPKLKSVVESWKNEDKEKHTLSSYLEKNEELKEIVLEESPWLADAMRETQRMQQLESLFDKNDLSSKRELAIRKLQSLQCADGSWSWYKGMPGSFYITESVVEQLVRLKHQMGNLDGRIEALLDNAFGFLDHFALKEYQEMLKNKDKGLPSESALHYLYASVLAERELTPEVKTMQNFYVERLSKSTLKLTIYGKSLSSYILNAFGKHNIAKTFVQSLREYSVSAPDMGRYYDTNIAYYSWMDYRIPTQVAAMTAMAAMKADFPDTDSYLNDMSLWLIRQKQVQMWDNPLNTVQVLFALLPKKDELWITSHEPVSITLDGSSVDFGKASAGIGYVKKSMPLSDKSVHSVEVSKSFNGISWGAVYGQCYELLDHLHAQKNNVSVVRRLFVERTENGKKQWMEVKPGDVLHVGEKVKTRLNVTSDRDIDFLEMKSERAACMEPESVLSGYRWQNGQGYYQSVKDASTIYFFDTFRKGTCTIEDYSFVNRTGRYQMGLTSVRCAYSAEFGGHSEGCKVTVE